MGEPRRHPDPLEANLVSFRPRSISHGLHSRIEASLIDLRKRRWAQAAFIGVAAVAAACVTITIGLAWSNRSNTNIHTNVTTGNRALPQRAVTAASPPSVMDYQQAFAESSDAFDALLARPAGSGNAPIRAFSFPSTDSINVAGDHK